MNIEFEGIVIEWRGPSPFYFVAVPDAIAGEIKQLAPMLTYGWGVIPATVTIGNTTITTSLFPKNGGYLVPLKDAVRKPEGIVVGNIVALEIKLGR